MLQVPSLIREVSGDLVKFYFKSQAAKVENELTEILTMVMEASSFEAVKSIGDLIVNLNADDRIEGSSLAKFMTLCNNLNLNRLLKIEEN